MNADNFFETICIFSRNKRENSYEIYVDTRMRNDGSGMPLFVHRRMHQSGGSFFWYHLPLPRTPPPIQAPNPISLGLRRHRFRRRNRPYPRQRSPLRTKPRGTSSGKSSHRTSPDFPVRTSSTQKLWRSNRMPWQTWRKPQRETAARDRRPHCSTRVYSTTRTAGCYRSG